MYFSLCCLRWLDLLTYFCRCDNVRGCVTGVGTAFNTTADNGIIIIFIYTYSF